MGKPSVRTCHGCHSLLDEVHKSYPSGAQKCPLEHWSGCKGGIAEGQDGNGKEWRGCPNGYVFDQDDTEDGSGNESGEDNEFHDTFNESTGSLAATTELTDSLATGQDSVAAVKQSAGESLSNSVKDHQEQSSNLDKKIAQQVNGSEDLVDVEEEDEERILRNLEASNRLLTEQFARQAAAKVEEERLERSRRIQLLIAENNRLSAGMNGDLGGAKTRPPKPLPASILLPHLKPASGKRGKSKNPALSQETGQSAFQKHLTRNQHKSSQKRPEQETLYTGLNIEGIRKIPELGEHVENLIDKIQDRIPSLSRPPTAQLLALGDPKRKDVSKQRVDSDHDTPEELGFVFHQRKDGSYVKVKVVRENQPSKVNSRLATVETDTESDSETSSDDDCEASPQPGSSFLWKRDKNGDKYFVEAPLEKSEKMVFRYVKDGKTGRSYKKLVPKDEASKELVYLWVIDPATGKSVQMLAPKPKVTPSKTAKSSSKQSPASSDRFVDHRFAPGTPVVQMRLGVRTPQRSSRLAPGDRVPAFVIPAEEKQGKEGKMPDIVQHARNCPVAWTSKITSDKLNMGLWCWAFMSDLLATRTGLSPTLSKGVLEARMQHFLNTLEVALQSSNPSEFDNHSWNVARLYAEKVQQKIDRGGGSWLQFAEKYGADSQPHELMAAREELAAKVTKKPKKDDPVKSKYGDKNDDKNKRTCNTWNSSSQEGKCEWETQNEGRNCDRRHECSWCKEKGKRSLHHQRSFCRQRLAAGDQ